MGFAFLQVRMHFLIHALSSGVQPGDVVTVLWGGASVLAVAGVTNSGGGYLGGYSDDGRNSMPHATTAGYYSCLRLQVYERQRGNLHESSYNIARAAHHLRLLNIAHEYYQRCLATAPSAPGGGANNSAGTSGSAGGISSSDRVHAHGGAAEGMGGTAANGLPGGATQEGQTTNQGELDGGGESSGSVFFIPLQHIQRQHLVVYVYRGWPP
jgi:hypothetical protein